MQMSFLESGDANTNAGNKKKKVLHVGCGPNRPERLYHHFRSSDWQEIRLDIDPAVEPDIISDITDMKMIDNNSMDALWSSHNLEHLFAHQVPVALAEFLRVLKPGGFIVITMPDLLAACEAVINHGLEEPLEGDAIPVIKATGKGITPLDIIYGLGISIASGRTYMAHKTGFTETTLARKLSRVGFIEIEIIKKDMDLWARAYKPAA